MGLGNGLPDVYRNLLLLTKKQQYSEARSLHLRLLPLYDFSAQFHSYGYNSVVKSVMKLRGRGSATHTREPFLPLNAAQEKELARILAESGLAGQ